MNEKPNIFIIYLAGSFGSFLANLFYGNDSDIKGDVDTRNAHQSKKQTMTFSAFSKHHEKLNDQDLMSFQQQNSAYGVHTLPFYQWLNFDFSKHFNNFVKIIIRPTHEQIPLVAKRLYEVFLKHPNDLSKNGIKDIVLKNLNLPIKKYPDYFLDEICIKETVKNLTKDYQNLLNYKTQERDIVIPYSNIKDINFLSKNVLSITRDLQIDYKEFPFEKAKSFLEKNQEYFVDNTSQIN